MRWKLGLAWLVVPAALATAPAAAAADKGLGRIVAHGRDIFRLPPNPHFDVGCDGRRLVIGDPAFGQGLVARYLYKRGPSDADADPDQLLHPGDGDMTSFLRTRGLHDPVFVRRGGSASPEAFATESFVIRSHDELAEHFTQFCEVPLRYGYYLHDIEYRLATATERRRDHREPEPIWSVEPVFVDRYRDIMPKGATVVGFTVPSAYWTVRNKLQLPAGSKTGMATIFEFEGANAVCDSDSGRVRDLAQRGFLVLYVDFNGMKEMIVIDTQPVTSSERLNARARDVMEFDQAPRLYLKRIALFAADHAGIADLNLPADVKGELKQQLDLASARYRKSDDARAHQMPTETEVEAMLSARWNTETDTGLAYSEEFAALGSTFGEVHDLACKRNAEVFSCNIGVTFLQDGKPKYQQSMLEFERDPASGFKLIDSRRPIVVT